MTRTRTAAEETEDWEVKEVVVPPVAKHSVEKVSRYRVRGARVKFALLDNANN